MNEPVSILKDTIATVQQLLAGNPEWIARYNGYADLLIRNHDSLQQLARRFNRYAPLQFYIQVSKAKASKSTLTLDIRYMGQNVAVLTSKAKGVFISTADGNLAETNARDFGFNTVLEKDTPWRSKEASEFRKFFSEREYIRLQGEGSKGNEEHNVESLLISEFEKQSSTSKQLLGIQPIKYASHKLRFAMPTPISASNHGLITYSGYSGGGIDILTRAGRAHSRPCVIEVKDENTKTEPPLDALEQAVAYAVFLRELLRSESGKKWWKILGYKRDLRKQLIINATIAMPYAEDRFVTDFGNKRLAIGSDFIECHYIYFSRTKDGDIAIEQNSLSPQPEDYIR